MPLELEIKIKAHKHQSLIALLRDVESQVSERYHTGRSTHVSGGSYTFKLTGQAEKEK